jgi:hypothetical protein
MEKERKEKPKTFIEEIENVILKPTWNLKRPQIAKSLLKKYGGTHSFTSKHTAKQ